MNLKIPNKLFERDLTEIKIGISYIHLYSKKEIKKGQEGYRYDSNGEEIKDWIGEEYIVIGHDSCCGDPIIAKTDEEQLPIYSMYHDEWNSLERITDSFDKYIEILKIIDNSDLYDEVSVNELINTIKKLTPRNALNYWEPLINVAHEFLTD